MLLPSSFVRPVPQSHSFSRPLERYLRINTVIQTTVPKKMNDCGGIKTEGISARGSNDWGKGKEGKRLKGDPTALSQKTQRIPTRLSCIPTSPRSTIHDIEFRIIPASTITKEGVSTCCNHTWLITIDVVSRTHRLYHPRQNERQCNGQLVKVHPPKCESRPQAGTMGLGSCVKGKSVEGTHVKRRKQYNLSQKAHGPKRTRTSGAPEAACLHLG